MLSFVAISGSDIILKIKLQLPWNPDNKYRDEVQLFHKQGFGQDM